MPSKKSSTKSNLSESETSASDEELIENNQDGRLPISRFVLFFLLAALGLAADLYSKWFCFKNYFDPTVYRQQEHWWYEGVFGIQTSTNPGALFGMGAGYSSVFATLSIVAIIGILLWLFVFKAAFDRWLTVALGLITGGILGNLYDRVGWGYLPEYPEEIKNNVRDWIYFRLEGVPMFDPWPNFNIADMLLVTGAIMLFLHVLFYQDSVESQVDEELEKSKELG